MNGKRKPGNPGLRGDGLGGGVGGGLDEIEARGSRFPRSVGRWGVEEADPAVRPPVSIPSQ